MGSRSARARLAAVERSAASILVVDDDPTHLELVKALLTSEGHQADYAPTPEEALRFLKVKKYELVISDLYMPGINGLQLLRMVKEQADDTEVVLMSANATVDAAAEALRHGAFDFVTKPFDDLDVLGQIVDRARDKREAQAETERLKRAEADTARASVKAYQLGLDLVRVLDVDELLLQGVAGASVLAGHRPAIYLRHEAELGRLRLAHSNGLSPQLASRFELGVSRAFPAQFVELSRKNRPHEPLARAIERTLELEPIFTHPVLDGPDLVGVLCAQIPADGAESAAGALRVYGNALSLAMTNTLAHRRERDRALVDELTGLHSRGYVLQALRRELARAQRYGRAFSVVLLDLDDFRPFNEIHGYPRGDKVLTAVAEALRGLNPAFRLRESDVPARSGDDEFLVVLPETPRAGACKKAEELRLLVQGFGRAGDLQMALTATAAVATFPDDGASVESLLGTAQERVERGRNAGGNRVVDR